MLLHIHWYDYMFQYKADRDMVFSGALSRFQLKSATAGLKPQRFCTLVHIHGEAKAP